MGQVRLAQPASCSAAVVHSATVTEPSEPQEDSLLQAALASELHAAEGVLVSALLQPKKATDRQSAAKA